MLLVITSIYNHSQTNIFIFLSFVDVDMRTQSPHPSKEQIDGRGDSLQAGAGKQTLTIILPELMNAHCIYEENCFKSDYIINGGPISVQKRWPGSVTGVP